MRESRQYELQEPKESLHWLSYNLKSIAKDLKALVELLDKSSILKDPIQEDRFAGCRNPMDNISQRSFSKGQEEIPF